MSGLFRYLELMFSTAAATRNNLGRRVLKDKTPPESYFHTRLEKCTTLTFRGA